MFTRRSFLRGLGGGAALAASFNEKDDAIAATHYVKDRSPDVAADEDFWFEVQQAFTVDRA
jgi:hypothetical protein